MLSVHDDGLVWIQAPGGEALLVHLPEVQLPDEVFRASKGYLLEGHVVRVRLHQAQAVGQRHDEGNMVGQVPLSHFLIEGHAGHGDRSTD